MEILIRCPKCHKENYALNVASGICTWCGFDINAEAKERAKNYMALKHQPGEKPATWDLHENQDKPE